MSSYGKQDVEKEGREIKYPTFSVAVLQRQKLSSIFFKNSELVFSLVSTFLLCNPSDKYATAVFFIVIKLC